MTGAPGRAAEGPEVQAVVGNGQSPKDRPSVGADVGYIVLLVLVLLAVQVNKGSVAQNTILSASVLGAQGTGLGAAVQRVAAGRL